MHTVWFFIARHELSSTDDFGQGAGGYNFYLGQVPKVPRTHADVDGGEPLLQEPNLSLHPTVANHADAAVRL